MTLHSFLILLAISSRRRNARMEFDTLKQCLKISHEIYSCWPFLPTGCRRLRVATTTATAAASSNVIPPIITIRTSISACFFATLLPYHPNRIIRGPLAPRPAAESHKDCTQWINRQSRNIHDNFKRGIIIIQKGRHQYNFCKDTPPWTQPIYKHLYWPK